METLRDIERLFNDASREISKEIEAFYARYSLETGVDLSEIRKRLDPSQFASVQSDIARYYSEVERVGGYSPEYHAYLRSLSARAYMSRLDDVQLQMRNQVERMFREVNGKFGEGLSEVWRDSYLRSVFNGQSRLGVASAFTAPNERLITTAIREKWLGANYSDRIWTNKSNLLESLNTTFMRGVAQGVNPNAIARTLSTELNTRFSNAVRLARTEFAHITNSANLSAYEQFGVVKQYRYVATLDKRTSTTCQDLDGQIFDVSNAVEGLNFPPMHPNCRSTTIAYFPEKDKEKIEQNSFRLARDPVTGKNYRVPANISYAEWVKGLTETQKGELMYRKNPVNDPR